MGVILTIKAGEGKKKLTKKTRELEKLSKGFPARKFAGKIKFTQEPVLLQRKLRDECK